MASTITELDEFDAVLRTDLPSFIESCFYTLLPTVEFQMNWHIEAIAFHLEQVQRGKIKRLIINLPPRSLKSIICSVAYPAFVLGHDPSARVIAVSYGSDLATKLSNDFRAILQSPRYRRLFPGTQVSRAKNTEAEVATTRNGFRLATSVGGTLTGRGGQVFIIDDPLKPQDALSDSKRQSANDWFYNTLVSRSDDKRTGAIILVMQRVHLDDLAGMLMRESDEWTVLNLPAIAEQDERIQIGEDLYHFRRSGDLLHPQREPLGVLDALRAELGPDIFAAQYQQNPIPPGGLLIKRDWVLRYDSLPIQSSATRVIQSWDTASKDGGNNEWSVCTTWMIHECRFYLMDVCRQRMNYPTLKAKAIALAQFHDPSKIFVEDTGVGTGLIPELRLLGLPAIAVRPEGNKLSRMSIETAKFEAGLVLLPHAAPWLSTLETELFSFPGGRHYDQIDSISQALANASISTYDSTMSWV